jgi:hypothetical protein
LKHGETCKTGVRGGCNVCKRISSLLNLHSRACRCIPMLLGLFRLSSRSVVHKGRKSVGSHVAKSSRTGSGAPWMRSQH